MENETKKTECTGFFGPEKKGIQNGILGGITMIVIAVVWFVLGYAAGIIFFYPPILFLIGVYACLKGLLTGNFNGNNKNETVEHEISVSDAAPTEQIKVLRN
jgi:hypothetical protein